MCLQQNPTREESVGVTDTNSFRQYTVNMYSIVNTPLSFLYYYPNIFIITKQQALFQSRNPNRTQREKLKKNI